MSLLKILVKLGFGIFQCQMEHLDFSTIWFRPEILVAKSGTSSQTDVFGFNLPEAANLRFRIWFGPRAARWHFSDVRSASRENERLWGQTPQVHSSLSTWNLHHRNVFCPGKNQFNYISVKTLSKSNFVLWGLQTSISVWFYRLLGLSTFISRTAQFHRNLTSRNNRKAIQIFF